MDVLVGPTFSIVQPRDGPGHGRMFAARQNGAVVTNRVAADDASSDSSSSIGAPDDSEEDDSKEESGDGDEAESKFNGGRGGGLSSLGSFASLEETLPIKRGLSNYFSGKSKSFASLSEVSSVSSVKEVEKRDNPFNKRRRVLIASKWSRKSSSSSSLYNWPNPKSMPLLTLAEDGDGDEDESEDRKGGEEEEEEVESDRSSSSSDEKEKLMMRRATPNKKKLLDKGLKSFKSQSCYCLSDLQEEED